MKYVLLLFILIMCSACIATRKFVSESSEDKVEMRGVWIASVENIDWPASKNLSYEELQNSFVDILDFYQALHYNAVFVQIRTAGDALYPSQHAPWSRYLTGTEGQALDQDILPWLIEQTHTRGMEFHAWMNPYRATTSLDTNILSKQHGFYLHREWMVKYGNRYYINPSIPEAQSHILDVIDEVVDAYDVDGIHFDDYFYPYKIKDEVFDDSVQYANRNKLDQPRDDWRREQINTFIQNCHYRINKTKPDVQFGVSPFGVWRNIDRDSTGSDSRAGQTVYDDLYADTRTWIKNGWLDYIAPQLYWSMEYPAASHRKLVDWWVKEAGDLPLYIGLGAYKVENNHDTTWNDLLEIHRQIAYGRNSEKVDGFITFSAKSIMKKPSLKQTLMKHTLLAKTLTPAQYFWKNSIPDIEFTVTYEKGVSVLNISHMDQKGRQLKIYYQKSGGLFRKKHNVELFHVIEQKNIRIEIPKNVKSIDLNLVNSMGINSRVMLVDLGETED